jgi:hypothetical protein
MPATRTLLILAAACLVTSAVWYRLHVPTTGIDDANIFFVYARHVSAGDGFVFNAGSEQVEGFTSLLWLLACSAAFRVGAAPERVLLALNLLLVTLTVVYCVRSSIFRLSLPWAAVFVVLLLSDYRYVAWNTVTLMESALWGCLLTLAALIVVGDSADRRRAYAFAALIALIVLTRPEAMVWVPVVLVLFCIRHAPITGNIAALRLVSPALAAYALVTVLLTMFRSSYFGFPLPNTYYAKISPSLMFSVREGLNYLKEYILSGPVPFACVLAVVVSIVHVIKSRFHDRRTLALSALAATGLAVPVLTGGDHFGGFRFYQSVYPILLLALCNCLRFVVPRYVSFPAAARTRRAVTLAGGSLLGAIFLAVQIVDWMQFDERMPLRIEFDIAELGRERGSQADSLFSTLHPKPSIGTITVGGFKYAYGGEVVDLMGLNNTRMAHNGGNRIGFRSHAAFETRTFYELKPALIIPLVQHSEDLASVGKRVSFVDVVLKGLLDDPRFRDTYRLAEVRRGTPGGLVAIAAWYEREFLSRLVQSKEFEIVIPAQPSS